MTLQTVRGVSNITEYAKDRVCWVVLPSSSSVYGDAQQPTSEMTIPRPTNTYASAKLASERILTRFVYRHTVFRIYAGYGNEAHKGEYASPVGIFLNAIQNGKELEVYGDGSQSRDYVYVEDITDIMVRAFQNRQSGLFNLGTGISTTTSELITKIESKTGMKANIKRISAPEGFMSMTQADIISLRSWYKDPMTTLDEGLDRILRQVGL